ncbi:helix-turn-helix domain-containing protein [Aggregatilinea lenta]|uniref:helix-turn-helix domain-containing protein n=1 Tax=Aggregatilinea lenta TaxID=913108 RepID=UPI000E5B48EF|nr:helix-turn-helix domain-containing protein [Aggregatilinea lenta]
MKLHARLKEVRMARDLTLKALAERSGLSISYLSDIERGRTTPSLSTLESLATALEMTVIDFLTGVDFAGETTSASLPPGLADLIEDKEYRNEITPEWVDMMSKIQLRGRRPQTKEDWLILYLQLKRILE